MRQNDDGKTVRAMDVLLPTVHTDQSHTLYVK